MSFHVPEKYRMTTGPLRSNAALGNNGAFRVPLGTRYAAVIASDGEGWEHVSVSFHDRVPTWDEMCRVKDLFWDAEDVVIQYHPRASEYVTNCDTCLHLWRPVQAELPTPPVRLVGIRPGVREPLRWPGKRS